MENKELCEEYPFIANRYSPYEYEYECDGTLLDDIPIGWKIAFGEQLCREIKDALAEDGTPIEEYYVAQAKEKFGILHWYDNALRGSKVHDVIRKYEEISAGTCVLCGEKATVMSTGWIEPYCDKCKERLMSKGGYFSEEKFIPIKG